MTPFDQALTHLLDVLSRADAGKIGRASHESLGRLIELTRQHTPAPSPSPQSSRPLQQAANLPRQTPPAPTLVRNVEPGPGETSAPVVPVAPNAPAGGTGDSVETTAPRRKLGLAEQLRAAMASGAKPAAPEPRPEPVLQPEKAPVAAPPPPAAEPPLPARAAAPPSVNHLPPEAQLEQLNEAIMAASTDPRAIVLGEGSARSELIFVGTAPVPGENAPIGGEVGVLFDKIIATMRLRKGDLYITNILKHPADAALPSPEEVEAELPNLLSEIGIIRPKCIVALGETALATLVGKTDSIHDVRGEWHSFRGIPVMATFHPGYLYENESKRVRRMFWEDMLQVLELLAKPITPRQREFFK